MSKLKLAIFKWVFCHQVHILKDQVKDMNSILLFSKFSFLQLPGAPTRPLAKIAALCRSSFPLSGRHLTITSALRPSSLNLAPSAPSSTGFTQIQLSPFSLRMGRINKYLCHKQGPASTRPVQNSGRWATWNICTGGMGYAGMYWVLSMIMEYLHWGYVICIIITVGMGVR